MSGGAWYETILSFGASTLRVSTPLLFAALGGLCCERSGVINIALEGMMLLGALGAAAGTLHSHSPWVGSFWAIGAGALLAWLYGLFVIRLRSNQIVAGTAINMLAAGIAPFTCKLLFGVTGNTPSIPANERLGWGLMALAWALVGVCHLWLKSTPSGLWLQFSGEHPDALDAAGIRVQRIRWLGVTLSGILAGLGGASLSIYLSSSFSRGMTAGRGFMALAALIFGKWRPIPTALACLLFGLADAAQIRLQGVTLWGSEPVPVQFIQILPYLLTIVVLAGWVGQSRSPRGLGIPFEKR